MEKFLLAMLIAFVIGLFISPLVIRIIKKLKIKQNVYEYVENHKQKQGTPTMGGLIFIIAICLTVVSCVGFQNRLAIICITALLSFGFLGFLDDFIKLKFKRNLGLRAYQKIIGQLAISIILCVFCYKSNLVLKNLYLPFCTHTINLGWAYIPFMVVVVIALTNSVNLTDGLDGLAGGTSFIYVITFSICLYIFTKNGQALNISPLIINEWKNLLIVCGASAGALLAYLLHNSFPALIFMGDTGSLALGGMFALLAITTGQVLIIPILGACFVASSVSVILQVLYYKLTKKRIFKMAPFHHHLELKGMHESKIVSIYIVISIVIGVLGILLTCIFV